MLVTAVALVNAGGNVFMQQRHLAAVHGGLWEFPGGKVEQGEIPQGAAIREIEEELAVTIAAASLEPVGFASGLTASAAEGGTSPQRPLVILLYAARTWQGEPQAREAAKGKWFPLKTLCELAMPPLDYPLAQALCRYLDA